MNRFLRAAVIAFAAAGTCCASVAEASNLDTYRNLLLKKTYTIRYVNITPEERVTNKDKVTLNGYNSMQTKNISTFMYKPLEGLITSDGKRKYEQTGTDGFYSCRLQTEQGTYTFTKYIDKKDKAEDEDDAAAIAEARRRQAVSAASAAQGVAAAGAAGAGVSAGSLLGLGVFSIFGSGKGEVSADLTNTEAYLEQGESYGSEDMTRLLNAFLPDSGKSEDMMSYEYVTEGWLPNGQNYVDYKAEGDNYFEAVRYYFDQYTLVKIASAQFTTDANGKTTARRNIIRIDQFSPTPAEEYLSLPENAKDVTKPFVDEDEKDEKQGKEESK